MTCPRCRTENPPQAKFCQECAAHLVARCASCGTQLPASAKFCPECARPAGGVTAAPPAFASPEAYTPTHLAEKILTSKAALEGERKQVTVLFADLKGCDEPSLGLAPLIVHEIMRLLAKLRDAGTTILLVEQNARMALRAADRAYVLETGSVVLSGTGAELLEDDQLKAAYLGG